MQQKTNLLKPLKREHLINYYLSQLFLKRDERLEIRNQKKHLIFYLKQTTFFE